MPGKMLSPYLAMMLWQLMTFKNRVCEPELLGVCRCLEPIPLPLAREQSSCKLLKSWPLVAVITDAQPGSSSGADGELPLPVSSIKLYSLQSHTYVHTIAVPGRLHAHLSKVSAAKCKPNGALTSDLTLISST